MDKATNRKMEATEKTLSRRQLLKAITATGGSLAVSSLLPDQWLAPVVEVGYLPAHAQTSLPPTPTPGPLTILNLSRTLVSLNDCNNGGNVGSVFQIRFEYDDPLGGVGPDGSTVTHHTSIFLPGDNSSSSEIMLQASQMTGDGFKGVITYRLCTRFGSSTAITNSVFITVGERQSNQLEITVPKPVGAQSQDSQPAGEEPL